MAIGGGTIGTMYNPFFMRINEVSPGYSYNQTLVTFSKIRPTTSSRVAIIGKPTTVNDCFLTYLLVSYVAATAAAGFDVMMGTQTIATINPTSTQTQGTFQLSIGLPGLTGGTTSTNLVSITPTGATITTGLIIATCVRQRV